LIRSVKRERAATVAKSPAPSCAIRNAGTDTGAMPVYVSVKARDKVTAGLAKPVDEEANTAAAIQAPAVAGT
jgi:hypothetical protein